MGGVMRQSAAWIGRPVVLFAAIIALCCLSGCAAIERAVEYIDDDENKTMQRNPDDEKDIHELGGLFEQNGTRGDYESSTALRLSPHAAGCPVEKLPSGPWPSSRGEPDSPAPV